MALNLLHLQLPPAGERDRPVYIDQAGVEKQNAAGEPTWPWIPLASEWAKVEPLSGREAQLGDQLVADADMLFLLPYVEGLTASEKLRIRCEGRFYDIQAVHEIGRRAGQAVIAKTRADKQVEG